MLVSSCRSSRGMTVAINNATVPAKITPEPTVCYRDKDASAGRLAHRSCPEAMPSSCPGPMAAVTLRFRRASVRIRSPECEVVGAVR